MSYDDDLEPRVRGRRRAPRKPYSAASPDPSPAPPTASSSAHSTELAASPARAALPFAETVQVTKAERAWIREHLAPFRDACLIDDVVRRIKAGKEATVYACSGQATTGRAVIAAKLYRARSLRGAKNTSRYQLGREVLNADGQAALPRAWRLHKAILKKTRKGQLATQTSWLMHEFTLLSALHARGAHVPQPITHNEYALLMEFIGDGMDPAPTLNEVVIDSREAKRLFEQLSFDIELLLELGWVHGDLSAHNILYQPGRALLIDFPQVVSCLENPEAATLFERDLQRLAQYFARMGLSIDAPELARELWAKHVTGSEP